MRSTGFTRDVKYSSNFVGSNVCVRGCRGPRWNALGFHSQRAAALRHFARQLAGSEFPFGCTTPDLKRDLSAGGVPSRG